MSANSWDCNVELEFPGCGGTSNGWSSERRMEQEDRQYMEQEEEQHGELDIEGGRAASSGT